MATTTITALSAASALSGTEPIPVDQSGATKKTTPAAIATYIGTLGGVQTATVTITAAQLADLDNTPVELVAAPGVDRIIIPLKITMSQSNNDFVNFEHRITYDNDAADVMFPVEFPILSTGQSLLCYPGIENNSEGARTWNFLVPVSTAGINTALMFPSGYTPPEVPGAISASDVAVGGADYVNGDTFTVDTGLGTLATGTITNAVAGVVQAGGYTLDTTPNGYLLGTGVATTATSGIGTGLTIDITALDYSANPMTLTVKTLYSVMDV